MNKFVKNNMILVVVLTVMMLAALALLVLAGLEHAKMTTYIEKTVSLRNEIKKLISQTPAPVKGNEAPLENNAALYGKAGRELGNCFGGLWAPAVDAFIGELAQENPKEPLTLEKFKEKFREKWNQVAQDNFAQQELCYKEFRHNFPKKWEDAISVFRKQAEKITTEPINDASVNELLRAAIGIPRRMDYNPEKMNQYLDDYRAKLLDMSSKVTLDKAAEDFTFATRAFTKEQFPIVPLHMDVIGDLYRRICRTWEEHEKKNEADKDKMDVNSDDLGIRIVENIRKKNMEGNRSGDFIRYTYSIEVIGSLKAIRKLVSLIDEGYQERRFYIVKSIFLYAVNDEAEALTRSSSSQEENANLQTRPEEQRTAPVHAGRRGRRGMQPPPEHGRREMPPEHGRRGRGMFPGSPESSEKSAANSGSAEAKKLLEAEKKKQKDLNYGLILIGGNRECRAVIDIDYVTRPVQPL